MNKKSVTDKNYKLNRIKSIQSSGIALLLAFLVLAISLPINLIAQSLNMKWDMTPNRLYTLTETSKQALDKLENNIEIYWLYNMDSIAADSSYAALYNTLIQYNDYDKIKIIEADPDTDEGTKTISDLGLNENLSLNKGDFLIKSGNIIKKVESTSMFLSEKATDETTGNSAYIIKKFAGENVLTGTIMYVDRFASQNRQPKIYFLTGHGEKSISGNYSKIVGMIESQGYQIEELNITDEGQIPDDAQLIVVAGPTEDISSDEKEQIDNYLDKGGNITFMMSPNEDSFDYNNIENIMTEYAIGMNYDIATETDSSYMINEDKNNIIVELLPAAEDSAVDLTSSLISMSTDIIPSVYHSRSFYSIYTDDYDNLTIEPVIQSYDTAIGTPSGGSNPDPDNTESPLYLSYYSTDSERNDSKVFVLGNADMIDNDHVTEEYTIVSYYLFLSSISWMHDTGINMGIPAKEKTNDYMTISSESTSNKVIMLFAVIPVIIAGIGVIVWSRRRIS